MAETSIRATSQPARTQSAGALYIVATPIGNLDDLTPRAREALAAVDVIAAEDTRHTGHLLKALGLATRLISLHEHNEAARARDLIQRLQRGESIALVSDAGTPLISDPGFEIVRAAVAAGVRVVPLPGACAAIVALSASGLATDRFAFEGFLPARDKQRRDRLAQLASEPRTLVFYEAPHRIAETLADLASEFGERRLAIGRELTKQYETFYYGTAVELAQRVREDADLQRGELVIVVEGAGSAPRLTADAEHALRVLLAELPAAQAAKLAARLTGGKRDELYRRAVELSGRQS